MSAGWREAALDLAQTALRFVPWPTATGLRRVGEPGPLSPVIVTGNYDLTVRRVRRALRGLDAWLVVAPSSGINVWCAAAGGFFSTHQIVTALKTSGVEGRVRHRRAILPQLAATGVLARDVSRRCGWRVRFGPVYAEDLPRYLARGGEKTDAMRHVRFALRERLEMALAWAFPAAILAGGAAGLLRSGWGAPLAALAAAQALAVFLLYDRLPRGAGRRWIFGAGAAVLAVAAVALAGGGGAALATAAAASALLTGALTFDYAGSTPVEGGAHFEQRRWRIALDPERCKGVYNCWQVCPEAVFEKREGVRVVDLAHEEQCVRCGACIVQCPTDALHFEAQDGTRIEPDHIRRFKLNLLGRRRVDGGAVAEGPS